MPKVVVEEARIPIAHVVKAWASRASAHSADLERFDLEGEAGLVDRSSRSYILRLSGITSPHRRRLPEHRDVHRLIHQYFAFTEAAATHHEVTVRHFEPQPVSRAAI